MPTFASTQPKTPPSDMPRSCNSLPIFMVELARSHAGRHRCSDWLVPVRPAVLTRIAVPGFLPNLAFLQYAPNVPSAGPGSESKLRGNLLVDAEVLLDCTDPLQRVINLLGEPGVVLDLLLQFVQVAAD